MGEHQYVLSQAADAPERERLALLERNFRPTVAAAVGSARHPARLALFGSRGGTWVNRPLVGRAGRPPGAGRGDRHQSAFPDRDAVAQRRGASARYPHRSLGTWHV